MNPLATFIASTVVAISLLLTLSPLAAALVLAIDVVMLIALLATRALRAKRIFGMIWPLTAMAVLSSLTTILYGRPSGETFFSWGLVCISQGSLYLALAIGLRILAIGIPAVALASLVDPTNLADSLTQLCRAPRRFVMGTLAAFRLLGLFVDDWQSLEMARRARGLGSGRGPIAAINRSLGQAFSLLVLSLRRASALALAMEARGINSGTPATRARTAEWKTRDWMIVLTSFAVAALALIVAAWESSHGGGLA
jgi:energy-coupling factor transport system permease protein